LDQRLRQSFWQISRAVTLSQMINSPHGATKCYAGYVSCRVDRCVLTPKIITIIDKHIARIKFDGPIACCRIEYKFLFMELVYGLIVVRNRMNRQCGINQTLAKPAIKLNSVPWPDSQRSIFSLAIDFIKHKTTKAGPQIDMAADIA